MSGEEVDDSRDIVVKLAEPGSAIDFQAPFFALTGKTVTFEGHTPEPNQAVTIYAREKLFNVFPISTEIVSGQSDEARLFSVPFTFGKLGYYTLYASAGGENTPDLNVVVLNSLIALGVTVGAALLAKKLAGGKW